MSLRILFPFIALIFLCQCNGGSGTTEPAIYTGAFQATSDLDLIIGDRNSLKKFNWRWDFLRPDMDADLVARADDNKIDVKAKVFGADLNKEIPFIMKIYKAEKGQIKLDAPMWEGETNVITIGDEENGFFFMMDGRARFEVGKYYQIIYQKGNTEPLFVNRFSMKKLN